MNVKKMFFWIAPFFCLGFLFSCGESPSSLKNDKESPVKGATTILVDETIFPIIEDVVEVFHSEYGRAKINLVPKSESEIITLLEQDKARLAIVTRVLDTASLQLQNNRKVTPRVTEFATDAVTLIGHQSTNDTLVSLNDVVSFLNGTNQQFSKTFVFDNPNSSNTRFLKNLAKINKLPTNKVFSVNNSKEVVKYISENPNSIGIVGVNWLSQPTEDLLPYIDKVKVLSVENVKVKEKNKYIKPNQTNIADGSYPLTRKLYLINLQGATGLGMGFASYIAGEQGQRIILKSGLIPTRMPSRQILVNNKKIE